MVTIREGITYRSSTGEKVGPMVYGKDHDPAFYVRGEIGRWNADGTAESLSRPDLGDLIAEWTDGPVRTVTRTVTEKTIEDGLYSGVAVGSMGSAHGTVGVSFNGRKTPSELRAAAAVLLELAGALDE